LVFVAGGVGITPLMSMLRAMRDRRQPRRVTLIYANRDPHDILFRPELAEMETGQWPALRVVYVLSQPPIGWSGQTGRVDAKRLEKFCHGFADKTFYVCCPTRMTKELVHGLARKGVSPGRIHCDYFAL
jgi:ferredoxin-NADP reductase